MNRRLVWVFFCGVLFGVVGCGSDSDGASEPSIYCCALTKSATACTSSNSTTNLQQSVAQWRSVGEKGDGEACKALVDADVLGCTGPTSDYDEADAITACAK